MNSFKVADEVRHQGGGPLMIVVAVNGDRVTCEWPDGKEFRTRDFLMAVLKRVVRGQAAESGQRALDD